MWTMPLASRTTRHRRGQAGDLEVAARLRQRAVRDPREQPDAGDHDDEHDDDDERDEAHGDAQADLPEVCADGPA